MACIAIASSDVTSKRLAAQRLARRLRQGGHDVVMIVRAQKHATADIDHRVLDLHAVDDGTRRRLRPVAQWRATRAASDAIPVERLGALLREIGADLLIVDNEEHELVLAAKATVDAPGVALLHCQFSIWPDGVRPPLDHALAPAISWGRRPRIAAAWATTRIRMRYRDLRYHVAGRKIERAATVRRLARRLGLARDVDRRVWLHPFVPKGLPTLVVGARELDLPGAVPDSVRHIGPVLDPVPDIAPEDRFATMLREATERDQRVVVCVFGAFVEGAGDDMLDRLRQVAKRRPDLVFVVGGADESADARGPQNLVCARWIPQRELLAHAAAAIVHSGTFTLHECAVARVPMVVYPFMVNDQLGNAERIRFHGLGVVGDRQGDSAATMAARLEEVLDDGEMPTRLRAMGEVIDAYGRDGVAVREVERLLMR